MHSLQQESWARRACVPAICNDLTAFLRELDLGAGVAVLTDDAIRSADIKGLASWVGVTATLVGFSFRSSDRARGWN